ncbi:MAG TPA: VTT domain-containing protein [Terriglobales bacterium]|nr:VTT domain-containing protein [Terriglobales bacterium]
MHELMDFLVANGYLVLFLWVLGEQAGLPVPAAPLLLAAGALIGMGKLSAAAVVLLSTLAAVAADLLWFRLGRRRGAKVLNFLCKVSLEPDSCVRTTQSRIAKSGPRSLLLAKFIPGLSTAAPPLAGAGGMSLARFLLFDFLGSLLWVGSFVLLGFAFSHQLELLAAYSARLGAWLLVLLLAALAAFLWRKYGQRRRFVKDLAVARIPAEELKARLEAGDAVTIVDLRHPLDWLTDPRTLPGALRMKPDEIEERHQEIPRDREIILYCT